MYFINPPGYSAYAAFALECKSKTSFYQSITHCFFHLSSIVGVILQNIASSHLHVGAFFTAVRSKIPVLDLYKCRPIKNLFGLCIKSIFCCRWDGTKRVQRVKLLIRRRPKIFQTRGSFKQNTICGIARSKII